MFMWVRQFYFLYIKYRMSSVQRAYVQRNNNVTQLVPEPAGYINEGGPFDISGSAVYTLNLPRADLRTTGIYYVDLSGVDTSGNLLDLSGLLFPIDISGNNPINILNFVVNVPLEASYVPGLEFTIFFKNIPYNRFNIAPLLTIGIVNSNGIPFPYILSPPFPPVASIQPNVINQSVTFKSDGTNYNVSASGPAGWMGLPALLNILTFYNTLPFFSP